MTRFVVGDVRAGASGSRSAEGVVRSGAAVRNHTQGGQAKSGRRLRPPLFVIAIRTGPVRSY
jgi:hypothetical protein